MKDVKRRSYDSPLRREQAQLTRGRILDAAWTLFQSQGYARTTIKQIAEEAEVAADTIYAVFGSKPRVLTALIDRALTHGEFANVLERPESLRVRDERTQRRQIELYVRHVAELGRLVRPIFVILRSAAAADPELEAVRKEMEGYRAENMRRVAGWIAERGKLRMPTARAGDTLWAVLSPDFATFLLDTRGWTEKQLIDWQIDTISRALLP
jgi:AcrR family transcriptional regulator